MVRFPEVKVDPWFQKQEEYRHFKRIPDDAFFACAYTVFMNPIDMGESVFYRRTNVNDELWIAAFDVEVNDDYKNMNLSDSKIFDDFGCAVSTPIDGDTSKACKTILAHLFRSRVGFNWPSNFIKWGMIGKEEFDGIILSLKNELDDYANQAKEVKSAIVDTAEQLGLHPEPTGEGPYRWRASCPGTNHAIWIDTAKDIFGCPWCRRKGGSDELIAFVKYRRAKKR